MPFSDLPQLWTRTNYDHRQQTRSDNQRCTNNERQASHFKAQTPAYSTENHFHYKLTKPSISLSKCSDYPFRSDEFDFQVGLHI